MRKLLTIFSAAAILLSASLAEAQITISTNTWNPPLGTLIQYKTDGSADATVFNNVIAGSGGGKTWDFTSHTLTPGFDTYIVSAATTPQISNFPGANFVMRTIIGIDTAWAVHVRGNTTFKRLGYVNQGGSGMYMTKYLTLSAEDWAFPIAAGNQWFSWRQWNQGGTPPTYTDTYDTTFYSVDAWGTAKYGANSVQCLRVVARTEFTFRFYVMGILVNTTKNITTNVYFLGAGFTTLAVFTRSVAGSNTFYSGSLIGDFANSTTDVIEQPNTLPTGYALEQNYPNPFNPRTEIRFSIPTRSDVRLVVYNIAGQEVKVLMNGPLGAGTYVADWDGTNQLGTQVATGIYLYRLEAGDQVTTRKMVFLK